MPSAPARPHMYVSHAVRSLAEHPGEGDVHLLLRFDDDADAEAVAEAVRAAGGEVVAALQFGGREVVLPETRVADLLAAVDVDSVETAGVHGVGDAGEDV